MHPFLHRIALGSDKYSRFVANSIKFPAKFFQLWLLGMHKDKNLVKLVKSIHRERGFVMWPYELAQLYYCATSAKELQGDFAEVGVYTGGTARLICEVKGHRALHLFDTFEGFPHVDPIDGPVDEKTWASDVDRVKAYLKRYPNVFFYKGVFPDTAAPVEGKKFAFVHMDVDLYRSMRHCLEFFYPRMVKGGIIIPHDYAAFYPGVRKAFHEFFQDKPEKVIELPTSQCLVIKQ